jgi:uncharacterized Zn finger protein (UPF0148 family)
MTMTDERTEPVALRPLNFFPPEDFDGAVIEPVVPEGKTFCPHCEKNISTTYFDKHLVKIHDIGRKREYKARVNKGAAVTPPKAKKLREVEIEPEYKHDEPLTVDGILATLVELRWPHTMPTKKVLEMVEVRAALAKFLS